MRKINDYDIAGFVDEMLKPLDDIYDWASEIADAIEDRDYQDKLLRNIQQAIDEIRERVR